MPSNHDTLSRAAAIITECAVALEESHTVDGDWRDDLDAKAEHDEMMRVVRDLHEMAIDEKIQEQEIPF